MIFSSEKSSAPARNAGAAGAVKLAGSVALSPLKPGGETASAIPGLLADASRSARFSPALLTLGATLPR
jgi:hypothetical protein